MATGTGRGRCITCGKEKRAVTCEGCRQLFCFDHLTDHRQKLSVQLDEIEMNRDLFRQTLTEQTNNPKNHSLIEQIDKWEEDSIKIIQQTAEECRQILLQHTVEHINQIEVNLAELTDHIRQVRKENDFNESDLLQLEEKLTQLAKKLDKASNVSILHYSTSFINKISVVISSRSIDKTYDGVWVEAEDGKIPLNAVIGGQEGDRHVYLVRFETRAGYMIPGKLVETNKIAEAPYYGVRTSSTYQVLTNPDSKREFKWIPTSGFILPEGALFAGKEGNSKLYVGRLVQASNSILVGKYLPDTGFLYYTHGRKEKQIGKNFEVLCLS